MGPTARVRKRSGASCKVAELARIDPGEASDCRRAARFVVSPMAV